MTLFETRPSYDPYRTIKDRTPDLPPMEGEDCFAYQCAINEVLNLGGDDALVTDGSCGVETGAKIWKVQRVLGITEDGLAGEETGRALTLKLIGQRLRPWTERYLLVQGITIKEAGGWRLGDYSEAREDGHYDAGITQQNTQHHDVAEAFNPVQAIPLLIAKTVDALGRYSDRSKFRGDDHSRRRQFALAAGSWNAPYYANFLAGVRPWAEPGPTATMHLEGYMAQATMLLRLRGN